MFEHHRLDPVSGFHFLEFLPQDTSGADAVVVYLHGSGERGADLSLVKHYGLPALLARSEVSVNCTVICPQLEAGAQWNADRLALLIGATSKKSQQIVLIGYSLGGCGVGEVVSRHGPSLVHVAVVIAGQAPQRVDVPQSGLEFLAIQGELDPWPCTGSFVESINASGGQAQSVALAGKGHYISEEVLFHPSLTVLLSKAGVEIATYESRVGQPA